MFHFEIGNKSNHGRRGYWIDFTCFYMFTLACIERVRSTIRASQVFVASELLSIDREIELGGRDLKRIEEHERRLRGNENRLSAVASKFRSNSVLIRLADGYQYTPSEPRITMLPQKIEQFRIKIKCLTRWLPNL